VTSFAKYYYLVNV